MLLRSLENFLEGVPGWVPGLSHLQQGQTKVIQYGCHCAYKYLLFYRTQRFSCILRGEFLPQVIVISTLS